MNLTTSDPSSARLGQQVEQMDQALDHQMQSMLFAERKKAEIQTLLKVIALTLVVIALYGLYKLMF